MKRLAWLGLATLLGCVLSPAVATEAEDPLHDRAAGLSWVEWPAEVVRDQPYRIRGVAEARCLDGRLILHQVMQDTAISLQAEWVELRSLTAVCDSATTLDLFSNFDVAAISGSSRTMVLRTTNPPIPPGLPVVFGTLEVVDQLSSDTTRAAGDAYLTAGTPGCDRMSPGAGWPNGMSYQLKGALSDDPGTFTPFWVEGYLTHESTRCQLTPADTVVFHLTAYRIYIWGPPDSPAR